MDQLISKIKTTTDAEVALHEIELLQKSLYEMGDGGFESTLNTKVRSWMANEIRAAMLTEGLSKDVFLSKLKKVLVESKKIILEIAFEPTQLSIDKFYKYIREEVAGGIILELKHNPKIIGGAVITFNGQYRDFSLNKLIDFELANMGSEILAGFNAKPTAQSQSPS